MHLRSDPGEPSVNSLQAELVKLDLVRKLGPTADLFAHARSHEVERFSQPLTKSRKVCSALAAFAHLRGRISAHAERKVECELLDDLKRVSGKQNILFELADASLARPDGVVREVVFPVGPSLFERDSKAWRRSSTASAVVRVAAAVHELPEGPENRN